MRKRHFQIGWDEQPQTKVLIETWPGFDPNDWLATLHDQLAHWEQSVQIRFVRNRWERYVLASEAHVYVSTCLSADFLVQAKSLQWVYLAIGGTEFLEDLNVPRHIKIITAAGISATGVAEHTIGLMIALDRRFDLAVRRQLKWIWDQSDILENIQGLRGRTVGLIGLGRNGRAIAALSKALGMRVIALDVRSDLFIEGLEALYNREQLLELLECSDFAILCLPLTRATQGMIGKKELEALGPNSYLINVARGGLVDEKALAWALRHGVIRGAALDVLSEEPSSRLSPLRGCPNLIVTPHVAGNIYTFREEIRRRFARNLKAFLNGDNLEEGMLLNF
ncbi:MAG: hypothetical protein ONB30_00210 [candidate division KSB1 bacterium]|nr:hypothetical protein [candidate division KSB1 bacterium]